MRNLFGVAFLAALSSTVCAQSFGPMPYLKAADSPWAAQLSQSSFYLETFEDGLFNVPGVSSSAGTVIAPGGITDSVDEDDGSVNGSGTGGRSFFTGSGSSGIRFTFDATVLGTLPTHAGIVWTDGAGSIRFEAFDAANVSLGVLNGNHADGTFSGTTAEDRFYGWVNLGGIKSILISNTSGGIEVDHLQYGAVPEPATMAALGAGLLMIARRRQARR